MWKEVSALLMLVCPCVGTAETSKAVQAKHLAAFTRDHPFGLLGEDFGILNENDLMVNECMAEPELFSSDVMSFSYWQCFATKDVTYLCDHGGTQDLKEGIEALIVLEVAGKKNSHEYIARRPWDLKSCERFGREFRRLTRNTAHICISGSLIDDHEIDGQGVKHTSWVFDKFKTKKGCDSYFEGDCSLRYQHKHGCKVGRKKHKKKR